MAFLFSQLHPITRKIVPWKKYSFKYQGPSAPGGRTVKISTEIVMKIASPHFQTEAGAVLPNSKKGPSLKVSFASNSQKPTSAVIYQTRTSLSVPGSYYIKIP